MIVSVKYNRFQYAPISAAARARVSYTLGGSLYLTIPEKTMISLAMTSNSSAKPCLTSFSYGPALSLSLSWPMHVMLHIITCPTLRVIMDGNDEKACAALRTYGTEPPAPSGTMSSRFIACKFNALAGRKLKEGKAFSDKAPKE